MAEKVFTQTMGCNPDSIRARFLADFNRNENQNDYRPRIGLIGAGTVGRAILNEHLKHEIDVVLADANADSLDTACEAAARMFPGVNVVRVASLVREMPTARLTFGAGKGKWHEGEVRPGGTPEISAHGSPLGSRLPSILIESIPENLALKQSLFVDLRRDCGADVILASNTSNLRIASVFEPLNDDPRCCGLHFFMPVADRPLVECVATPSSSPFTQDACQAHALRIGKQTLHVRDSPGFVVNRLLAPYLNQSLLMLEHGLDASLLASAAASFGMPMSPLKLIDTIGIRTAFDSGRVFWQSFPTRLDPASILAGMIKANRDNARDNARGSDDSVGTKTVSGFYTTNSIGGQSQSTDNSLSEQAIAVIARYQREVRAWTFEQVMQMIAIPMWIEAAEVLAAGIVSDFESIELAMHGGLGFIQANGFFGFFDSLGAETIIHHVQATSQPFRALCAPVELVSCLATCSHPSQAVSRYVAMKRRRET